ncbi:class I SAM-dependent methyltransferase [Dyella tabacisoli]|uniref:SAM-dependent methyltransferase n=1 Tax=Dyella tabacisoli TaxID=2282381 RepID=A0A369UKI3_9GAMM|nr:methyltransferase [Dyella tabacisoli]RDD81066.1 SAM-dependent methyltransferase [Dyella tabacisoli]
MTTSDLMYFLRHWFADPARIGAIAPSSAALAQMMTREITCRSGRVIELGAGTGVFTRALLARGVREANLVLVEQNADFALLLRTRFPQARLLRIDAIQLGDWARVEPGCTGAVVSGLPLLNLTAERIMAILTGAFACLTEDGAFYQFTYGLACPIPRALLLRLDLEATRIGYVVRNMPPAAVYRIRRRGMHALDVA